VTLNASVISIVSLSVLSSRRGKYQNDENCEKSIKLHLGNVGDVFLNILGGFDNFSSV